MALACFPLRWYGGAGTSWALNQLPKPAALKADFVKTRTHIHNMCGSPAHPRHYSRCRVRRKPNAWLPAVIQIARRWIEHSSRCLALVAHRAQRDCDRCLVVDMVTPAPAGRNTESAKSLDELCLDLKLQANVGPLPPAHTTGRAPLGARSCDFAHLARARTAAVRRGRSRRLPMLSSASSCGAKTWRAPRMPVGTSALPNAAMPSSPSSTHPPPGARCVVPRQRSAS